MAYARRISLEELSLLFCLFLDLFGFGMVFADVQFRAQALTPKGWPTGAVVGLALASTFIVQSLVSPHWGRVSDRIGRKKVIVVCTTFSACAMAVYGEGFGLAAIFVSRIIAGFGGANVAIAQAFLADRLEGSDRTAALGRVGAMVSAGLVVGSAFGGWLIHTHGYHLMAYTAAIASAIGALTVALILPADRPNKNLTPKQTGSKFRIGLLHDLPAVRPYAIIAVVAWLSLATLEGTFGRLILKLFRFDQKEFGMLFGYEALVGFIVQALLLSLVLGKFRESTLLRVAYVCQGIGLALNPASAPLSRFAPPLLILFVASTIYAVGSGFANPIVNGICSRLTPQERQGELFGLLQGARSVGFIVGPIVGGLLFDRWAPAPYCLAGLVCVAAALLVPSSDPLAPVVRQGRGVQG